MRGVTGSGIGSGVYMAYGTRESSSGGPFFRDIEQQGTSAAVEAYNYMWSGHNDTEAQRLGVRLTLSSGQIAARTVRIGITAAYAGGRPQITVNNWTSPAPAASSQPDSRGLTIGTYRGNNTRGAFLWRHRGSIY